MTLIKAIFVGAILLYINNAASADQDKSHFLFSISKNSSARVGVVNRTDKALRLKLVDVSGTEIINLSIPNNSNYFKLYDLTKLTNGIYYATLTGKNFKEIKKFKVNRPRIAVHKVIPPRFKRTGSKNEELIISYFNSIEEKVSISFECNNKIVFEDLNLKDQKIVKKYSFAQLPKGNYLIKLSLKNRTYTHSFSKL